MDLKPNTSTDLLQSESRNPIFGNSSAWCEIIVLLIVMFGLLCITVAANAVFGKFMPSGRDLLLISATTQNILAFFLAAYITVRIFNRHPLAALAMNHAGNGKDYLYMLKLYVFLLPTLNFIIDWNANMHLPASMQSLEASFRAMEDQAEAVTSQILSVTSVGGLIVNVLIIGILTGICEEVFFRGALQRILSKIMPVWGAIVIAGLFFSLMHFQFFGFIPRFIIGAFLGWMMWQSGSIWVSAAGHALNNSLVVIAAWFTARGHEINFDKIGVTDGFPWLIIVTLIAFICAVMNYSDSKKKVKAKIK